MSAGIRLVTIWSVYGENELARLRALITKGFDVIPFAHADYQPTYPFFRSTPDRLVVINRGSADRINPLLSLWRTWRLLRVHQPRIVLTAGYERPETLAAWLYSQTIGLPRKARRAAVIIMLDNRADDHPRRRVIELIKSTYLRLFSGFLASGSDSRDYLESLGVPRAKIELGYDCVDNERIATLTAHYRHSQISRDQSSGYFLCINRLVAKKNIPGVIRAYRSYIKDLADSVPPAPLVICGDGPERSAVQDLIKRLGLTSSVSLVGELVGLDAVARQLAGCRTLILASTRDETWGLVVNEALAAGCPVLVSKQCGCARDLVVQGINGFVFDGGDSDQLARCMLWIHTHDDLRGQMGRISMKIAAGYTTSRFAASTAVLAGCDEVTVKGSYANSRQV